MTLDLLAIALPIELIERTSSTVRVQQVVQLSLPPAFLLAGIGAIMNVMTNRLVWIAERIERIQADSSGSVRDSLQDLPALEQRRIYAQRAVMFSTAAALSISVVIALIFISPFVRPQLGTVTAAAWLTTMALLMTGLTFFLLETRTAARRSRERMRSRMSGRS
jgi:hypothetical protein